MWARHTSTLTSKAAVWMYERVHQSGVCHEGTCGLCPEFSITARASGMTSLREENAPYSAGSASDDEHMLSACYL